MIREYNNTYTNFTNIFVEVENQDFCGRVEEYIDTMLPLASEDIGVCLMNLTMHLNLFISRFFITFNYES